MAGEDQSPTQPVQPAPIITTTPQPQATPASASSTPTVTTPTVQVHTPTPPTAAVAAAYTQWATAQIPIDPALTQQSQHATHTTTNAAAAAVAAYQHYQAYAQHYPSYAAHYQYHQQIAQQQQQAAQAQQQQQQQQQQQAQAQAQQAQQQAQQQVQQAALRQATQSTTPVLPAQPQPTPAPVVAQQQQAQIPTAASIINTMNTSTAAAQAATTGIDTSDIATLNDALGSAGVDLRAEEESLHRAQPDHFSYRHTEDRTRKQPPKPAFNTQHIHAQMKTHASAHKITRIPEDSVNYLSLALRARLQDLLVGMIHAAQHRTNAQFDRKPSTYEDGTPMWSIVVRSDVGKQLEALERVEREEELRVRRERKERAEMAAKQAAALAQAGPLVSDNIKPEEDMEGNVKKKRKKEMGPGVTAKNMSEDVRKKMSNAVATQAAGLGGRYAWMTSANAAPPKPKAKVEPSPAPQTPATSSWARPYVSKKPTVVEKKEEREVRKEEEEEDAKKVVVCIRDAMFVIAEERGHGGGRGSARGWV